MKKFFGLLAIVAAVALAGCSCGGTDTGSSSSGTPSYIKSDDLGFEPISASSDKPDVAEASVEDEARAASSKVVKVTPMGDGTAIVTVVGADGKTKKYTVVVSKELKCTITPISDDDGSTDNTGNNDPEITGTVALPYTCALISADSATAIKAAAPVGVYDSKKEIGTTVAKWYTCADTLSTSSKAADVGETELTLGAVTGTTGLKAGVAKFVTAGSGGNLKSDGLIYFTSTGDAKIDDIVSFNTPSERFRMRDTGAINFNGDSGRYIKIDTSEVKAVAGAKVNVSVKYKPVTSSSGSADSFVAFCSEYAVDGTGNAKTDGLPTDFLKKATVDTTDGQPEATITYEATKGDVVYFAFSRSGAKGGGLDVTAISIAAVE